MDDGTKMEAEDCGRTVFFFLVEKRYRFCQKSRFVVSLGERTYQVMIIRLRLGKWFGLAKMLQNNNILECQFDKSCIPSRHDEESGKAKYFINIVRAV